MVLQIYNSNSIGTGICAHLGTTDDIYVGADGFLGSTDSYAIYGTGSGHSVTVEGSLVASSNGVILGDNVSTDSGHQVSIGEGGLVVGFDNIGIIINGFASNIENHGVIRGYSGIVFSGDAQSGASTLINNGEILATGGDAVIRSGGENFLFANSGITSGWLNAYFGYYGYGEQTVINTGVMSGDIFLGQGNDIYEGAEGKVTNGTVKGSAGDDRITCGRNTDWLQGDVGRDLLKGNSGADHFIFIYLTDSTTAKAGRDLIYDFSHAQHDRIDLSTIDSSGSTALDDAFSFIGRHSFSGEEGELRYRYKGSNTFVDADTGGDRHADFSIELKGHLSLVAGDFIL